jgi:hypothetical protein
MKEIDLMSRWTRTGAVAAVCLLLAWGVGRAAISKYQQKRNEILEACKAERGKLSPAEQKGLDTKCPTPEISLVSPSTLTPGQTADVSVTGKFPAGTRFLFESDCIEVLKESVAPNSYHATIKVGPGCGPQNVDLSAFAPVCCKNGRRSRALVVAGSFAWEFTASNSWRVKAKEMPGGQGRSADPQYMLEFYRGNEAAPFTKHRATLFPSQGNLPSYSFSINQEDEAASNPMREMEALGQKLSDPNLSDDERDKLTKKMEELTAGMEKQVAQMSDPAYLKKLQAQQEEFGCSTINVTSQDGNLAGTMNCGQKVGNLKITGTMKYLGK